VRAKQLETANKWGPMCVLCFSAHALLCHAVQCCAVQAGAGLVADSVPESEYEETLNKAAALGRAIDLAEQAFVEPRCE
jgi:hypothetical protein